MGTALGTRLVELTAVMESALFFIRLLDLYNLSAVVITALWTNPVRQLLCVALRAFCHAGRTQLIRCRTSCVSALLGYFSLWYRHLSIPPRGHAVRPGWQTGFLAPIPADSRMRLHSNSCRSGYRALCSRARRENVWAD